MADERTRAARIEDVHELALGMPHVTVERGGGENPVYQVGGKSLQLLREVPHRIGDGAGHRGRPHSAACSS